MTEWEGALTETVDSVVGVDVHGPHNAPRPGSKYDTEQVVGIASEIAVTHMQCS